MRLDDDMRKIMSELDIKTGDKAKDKEIESEIQVKSAIEEDDYDYIDKKKHNPKEKLKPEDEEDKRKKKKRNIIFSIIIFAIVIEIVEIILFIVTEDTSLPIVLVDRWTIVHFVLFIILLAGLLWMHERIKKEKWDRKYGDSPEGKDKKDGEEEFDEYSEYADNESPGSGTKEDKQSWDRYNKNSDIEKDKFDAYNEYEDNESPGSGTKF